MEADTTTRVPATVDALVERLTIAFGSEALVLDGPRAAQDLPPDVVVIGQPNTVGEAFNNDVTRTDGLGHRYVETFEIYCVVSSTCGDTDMKARRDRCLEMLAVVENALKEDRGIGGACDVAGLGPNMRWAQAQTKDGAVCDLAFSVVGRAAL